MSIDPTPGRAATGGRGRARLAAGLALLMLSGCGTPAPPPEAASFAYDADEVPPDAPKGKPARKAAGRR